MNVRLPLLLVAVISGPLSPVAAQQDPPTTPATPPENNRAATKPASPTRAAAYRYLAKNAGKPVGQRSRAATRSGTAPPVKLVALAPAEPTATLLARPRLWWWQSHDTRTDEVEFTLTRMDAPNAPIIDIKMGPLKAGYNAIDLSQAKVNPREISLEPGVDYQWSVGVLNGLDKNSIFLRIRRLKDDALAAKFAKAPFAADTVTALSAAGNWYELFDPVAITAKIKPQDENFVTLRQNLLDQIGLAGELTAK
jgi:hypothetical protein